MISGLGWLLFVTLMFAGGASRNDEPKQLLVVWVATAVAAVSLYLHDRRAGFEFRLPLVLLTAFVLLLLIQILPLPPVIWESMAGRDFYVRAGELIGVEDQWRPLSLMPFLTYFSLVSMIVPAAVLLHYPLLGEARRKASFKYVCLIILVAVVVGSLQAAAGQGDLLHGYRVTTAGAPVGSFANRNHQALLLACSLPIVAVADRMLASERKTRGMPAKFAAPFLVTLILILIMVTGSRGGVLAGAMGFAAFLVLWSNAPVVTIAKRSVPVKWLMVVALPIFAIGLATFAARSEATQRIMAEGYEGQRTEYFEPTMAMLREFFPWGSGFGSFATVFQRFEPRSTLAPEYVNQAHNDILQIVVEGGLLAAVLVLAFLAWFTWRAVPLVRRELSERSVNTGLASAAASVIVIVLVFSAFDYPLRTPMWAALFMLMMLWLEDGTHEIRAWHPTRHSDQES